MRAAGSLLFSFTYRFTCSLLLGVAGGLALSLLFRRVESLSTQPIKESSLILLTGYTVYLLGEFLGLSGVIALFTTAIIFSMYGFNNLSQ
jgi:NhaP-type Na+/H+ or K+/H+ antiporter